MTDRGTPARSTNGLVTITVVDTNDPLQPSRCKTIDCLAVDPVSLSVAWLSPIRTRQRNTVLHAGCPLRVPQWTASPQAEHVPSDTSQRNFDRIARASGRRCGSCQPSGIADHTQRRLFRFSMAKLPRSTRVSRDRTITALDALQVINYLNLNGSQVLPSVRSLSESQLPDWDVNGDGMVSPIDALLVTNFLNINGTSSSGEGESSANPSVKLSNSAAAGPPSTEDLLTNR